MKKKLSLLIITISSMVISFLGISCGSGEKTGPRGGVYTISSGGNKEYHGHHSNYKTHGNTSGSGGSGTVIFIIIISIILFVVLIALCIHFSEQNNKNKRKTDKYKNYQIKPKQENQKNAKGEYIGDKKWNQIGVPFFPKMAIELKGYTIGITGSFDFYSREKIISILSSRGIDIDGRRKTKMVDLWILGKQGTLGKSKLDCIKPWHKIVEMKTINIILENIISKKDISAKKLPVINKTTHPHLYEGKARDEMLNKMQKNKAQVYTKICRFCQEPFKTYIELRTRCRNCKTK